MEKVIIFKLIVPSTKRTQLFDIILPENYPELTGISVSSDKYMVNELSPRTNIPIGFLRLFIPDTGDELFSEAVFADATIPEYSAIGSDFTIERIYNSPIAYCPLGTKINSQATIINGFYQDNVLTVSGTYTIFIYLHFENDNP
jgi:hypothetical protein